MPDVDTQLRDYFDEVVERVTEEDIRIRATTARGIPVRLPRFRVRPVAALATGFGIAMTLLGGVMVVARFLSSEPGDVGGNGVPGGSTTPEPGSPWLLLLLMAGFGLLAFGMWSMRRSAGDVRERGEEGMQTIERPEAAHALPGDMTKLKSRNRMLTWLVGILVVAVIGLGAWLVTEMSSSSDTGTLPAAAEAAMDDYLAAWETNDRDLFIASTAESYSFTANGRKTEQMAQSYSVGTPGTFEVESIVRAVTGEGPYYISQAERIRVNGGEWYDGQSIYTLAESDGTWKVANHTWIGDF